MSKINRGSDVLVVLQGLCRRGSVREGRVQVRGGVRRVLPSLVRGERGRWLPLAASSSFGPRRFRGLYGPASWPVSHIAGAVLIRTAGPAALAAWYPSTLPSWTHEDTSVHARERDQSPEERRPLGLTV